MLQEDKELYEFGPFRLDVAERTLARIDGANNGALPDKSFQTLCVLLRNHGRLLSKQELLDHVWPDSFVEENNLDKSIHAIRHVLGEKPGEARFIQTVRKHGYRFVAEVRRIEPVAEPASPPAAGDGQQDALASNGAGDGTIDRPSYGTAIRQPSVNPKKLILLGLSLVAAMFVAVFLLGNSLTPGERTPESPPIDSIAVLPFVNETGNAYLEYLSDGLTESLIDRLSQVPNLNVKARSTVFRYKGKHADPRAVGNELTVHAVLFGRIVQRGDSLTLSLELADGRTGDRIWGDQYIRTRSDIVSLQSEIARDVTERLRAKLSLADENRLAKNYTENAEAYLLYVKGRMHWNKRRTPKDFEKAIEYFEQAIAVDPNYALAYAGLSDAYLGLSAFDGRPPKEWMPKVKDFAIRAIAIDDQLAEGHAAFGSVLFYDFDFEGAEREYKRAIELNPKSSTIHHFYASLLGSLGRHEEALAESQRALEIDPLSLPANWHYGINLTFARKYEQAIEQLRKTMELDPDFALAYLSLGISHEVDGNHAEAVKAFARYEELIGNVENAAVIRDSFAKGGWRRFLQVARRKLATPNTHMRYPATFHVALGENDKALAELNKAYNNRDYHLVLLKVDPRLDRLRGDPRFADLLRRIGFPN